MTTLFEAIQAYKAKFDTPPPIWEMPEDEAIAAIERALETGVPFENPAEQDLPEDAYL